MDFEEWEPYYQQVVADLQLDRGADEAAATELAGLLDPARVATLAHLNARIFDHEVSVFGDGPALRTTLAEEPFEGTLIAADGATSALMEAGLVPSVVVTDLDGKVEDQIEASARGALLVVHAHGDNLPALRRWVPQLPGPVVPTTQSRPRGDVRNFGGFTDGDRAVFLADHFGARRIDLVAFDFDHPSTTSGKEPTARKLRKLTWAAVLIAMLDLPNLRFHGPDPLETERAQAGAWPYKPA